jgi:CubicO group peptidase (beta-lactamase class C family)
VALATLCGSAMPAGAPRAEPARVDPVAAGWNAAALDEVTRYVASQKSTGLVILQGGQLIVEKTWPLPADARVFRAAFVHGTAPDGALLEDVASQQKSFVAILAGIAVDKGLLDLSQPVSAYIGPGWSKATPQQEAAITVRHLMEMNSGLKEDLSFEAAPDTKFFYNTPAYAVMKPVLEAAAKQPLAEITQAWLARPAAMHDTAWLDRPALMASAGNPTGLVTTPRDIARMGQLVLNGGVSDAGVRVISKAQLDALFVPTKTNPSYGRLWWLNGGAETVGVGANAPRRPGPLIGAAPADMVAAMGALDRKLYVVPSRRLVVVRTGQAAPDRGFDEQLWRLLVRAMPGS